MSIDRGAGNADIPTLVVRQISSHIMNGALQPGDKLPSELEMTRRFGISRISLREAMKLLEAKGYIESKGRKGKYVRPMTGEAIETPLSTFIASGAHNLSQLFEVKRILGGELAFMAATKATEEEISSLKMIVAEIESHVRLGSKDSLDKILSLYYDFFQKMSEMAQNRVLSHLDVSFSGLLKQSLAKMYRTLPDSREKGTDILSHLVGILSAIEKQSPAEARIAIYQHIDFLREKLCA